MSGKSILVVVDPGGERHHALERAGWLAERMGATVELFACDYDSSVDSGFVASVWSPEPGPRERILFARRRQLEELAAPLRARGVSVAVDVVWDFPFDEAIVRKVAATRPWLVAKDTEHHNIVQRTLLTNTDWHLIRHCSAPLWLVKPRALAARPRILAAVDPVHEHDKPVALDDAIFRFAKMFTKYADGDLEILHAFALPMDLELPPDVRELVLREHREAMMVFIETYGIPRESVHLVEGRAHECLQRAAVEHSADVVVMGAIARRGLSRVFIGSTAERVLDRLPCDLVIVKPVSLPSPSPAAI